MAHWYNESKFVEMNFHVVEVNDHPSLIVDQLLFVNESEVETRNLTIGSATDRHIVKAAANWGSITIPEEGSTCLFQLFRVSSSYNEEVKYISPALLSICLI